MLELLREKLNYFKFATCFLAMMVGILAFHSIGGQVIEYYQLRQQVERNTVENKALDNLNEETRLRQMADVYGGETPEATLKLYVTALERGDYALAAKYFTEENRDHVLIELKQVNKKELGHTLTILKTMKRVEPPASSTVPTAASRSKIHMFAVADGVEFLIEFSLYPNGVWKIVRGA